MAFITSLSITTDYTNYSRYSTVDGRHIVNMSFTVGPTTGLSDTLTVTIQRTSTYQGGAQWINNIDSNVQTISQPITIFSGSINLTGTITNPLTFSVDLRALADQDGFISAHFSYVPNDYTIRVVNSNLVAPVIATTTFTVLSSTVDEMKNRWLYGLPLIAHEQLQAIVQPSIGGVTVTSVGFGTQRGSFPISFTPGTPSVLTFNNGPPVNAVGGSVVLFDGANNFITVALNPAAFPGSATNSTTLLEYNVMSDTTIMQQIIQSTFDAQRGMKARLEPTHIVTRSILQYAQSSQNGGIIDTNGNIGNIPTSWDELEDGITFFKPTAYNRWPAINTGLLQILKVNQLMGFFNQQLTVVIPHNWVTHDVRGGVIQLVPTNYAILNWILAQAAFYFFVNMSDFIPNFWAVDTIVGFRDGIKEDIREYIAICAAIVLLQQAAAARWPAGMTGYSISRDGVAESASLFPGIYLGYVEAYMNIIGRRQGSMVDDAIKRLRQTYVGMYFTVL